MTKAERLIKAGIIQENCTTCKGCSKDDSWYYPCYKPDEDIVEAYWDINDMFESDLRESAPWEIRID